MSKKTVLLTGAGQGIGRAAAIQFVKAGYQVALLARSAGALNALAADLGPQNACALPADVSRRQDCLEAVQQARAYFGGIDILVNNAGVGLYGPSHTANPNDVRQVMAVNFFGPLYLMQAVAPVMQANGGGLIINVSSIIGRRSTPLAGPYCAAKAALEHLVEAMRVELAAENIRFSTLYPGITRTDFTQHVIGQPQPHRSRIQGVSAERVAARLVTIAQKEPRDAYVTLFDRLFVAGSHLFPGLVDWVFGKYFL